MERASWCDKSRCRLASWEPVPSPAGPQLDNRRTGDSTQGSHKENELTGMNSKNVEVEMANKARALSKASDIRDIRNMIYFQFRCSARNYR